MAKKQPLWLLLLTSLVVFHLDYYPLTSSLAQRKDFDISWRKIDCRSRSLGRGGVRAAARSSSSSLLFASAQRTGTDPASDCLTGRACQPWKQNGPITEACSRDGGKIHTVFMLEVADEDQDPLKVGPEPLCDAGGETGHNVSYAFCPGVDELQAFNLSLSGQITSTYVNIANNTRYQSNTNGTYLSAFGFGTWDSREFPRKNFSQGSVIVSGGCPVDDRFSAIVPMVILNISLENGRLKYYKDFPQPAGTGFVETCTKDGKGRDRCLLDEELKCIGEEGAKQCAICYGGQDSQGVEDLVNTNIQVWVSYYGTDRNGRQLRSGTNNPLGFRKGRSFGSLGPNTLLGLSRRYNSGQD